MRCIIRTIDQKWYAETLHGTLYLSWTDDISHALEMDDSLADYLIENFIDAEKHQVEKVPVDTPKKSAYRKLSFIISADFMVRKDADIDTINRSVNDSIKFRTGDMIESAKIISVEIDLHHE